MADNLTQTESEQLQDNERDHVRALNALEVVIFGIYARYITKLFLRMPGLLPREPEKPLLIDRHPLLAKYVNATADKIIGEVEALTVRSMKNAWELSNKKNDNWLMRLLKGRKAPDYFFLHNQEALKQFIERKQSGFTLSERVWRLRGQVLTEIESGIQTMISEGTPAARMATQMKQYLKNPDALFRRVRNQYGNLVLSKRAKEFHPGRGVYRSAYRNALRLTRNETNMAYRTADHERWKRLNFVLGVQIRTSGNHPVPDLCDHLAGKYPKDFKFTGWHVSCRCVATPIRPDEATFGKYLDSIMEGQDPSQFEFTGHVKEVPKGMTNWIDENRERVNRWKHTPFFMKDNPKFTAVVKTTNT